VRVIRRLSQGWFLCCCKYFISGMKYSSTVPAPEKVSAHVRAHGTKIRTRMVWCSHCEFWGPFVGFAGEFGLIGGGGYRSCHMTTTSILRYGTVCFCPPVGGPGVLFFPTEALHCLLWVTWLMRSFVLVG